MISLAITSMLLTAIAAAFQSSSQVIQNNDRFFRATQSARVAINQIITEVRRCDAIDDSKISSNLLPILRPVETRPANEAMRFYKYDAANKRLVIYFQHTDGTLSAQNTPLPRTFRIPPSPGTWALTPITPSASPAFRWRCRSR